MLYKHKKQTFRACTHRKAGQAWQPELQKQKHGGPCASLGKLARHRIPWASLGKLTRHDPLGEPGKTG